MRRPFFFEKVSKLMWNSGRRIFFGTQEHESVMMINEEQMKVQAGVGDALP